MVVELISVGTELLLGNIVNTNAQYLAEQCALLGLSIYNQCVVGDNKERLAEAFRTALKRSDLVILTGGLGPTEDDLTKEVCAQVMGIPLYTRRFRTTTGSRRRFRREQRCWTMTTAPLLA